MNKKNIRAVIILLQAIFGIYIILASVGALLFIFISPFIGPEHAIKMAEFRHTFTAIALSAIWPIILFIGYTWKPFWIIPLSIIIESTSIIEGVIMSISSQVNPYIVILSIVIPILFLLFFINKKVWKYFNFKWSHRSFLVATLIWGSVFTFNKILMDIGYLF